MFQEAKAGYLNSNSAFEDKDEEMHAFSENGLPRRGSSSPCAEKCYKQWLLTSGTTESLSGLLEATPDYLNSNGVSVRGRNVFLERNCLPLEKQVQQGEAPHQRSSTPVEQNYLDS